MKYRTRDGDALDAICARHYGDLAWRIEEVIAANPGLAARGPVLPSGVIVDLPEIAETAPEIQTLRLWQ